MYHPTSVSIWRPWCPSNQTSCLTPIAVGPVMRYFCTLVNKNFDAEYFQLIVFDATSIWQYTICMELWLICATQRRRLIQTSASHFSKDSRFEGYWGISFLLQFFEKTSIMVKRQRNLLECTTKKTMAGSIQNQQRIVGHGCCFGRGGSVRLQ